MYPFWGNAGGFGGSGPRNSTGAPRPTQPAGFGGFEASPVAPTGSSFSNLQQQHMQQMQQLQMLYQKQLQSVLLHGNSGPSAGFQGQSWNNEAPGPLDGGARPQPFTGQNEIPKQQVSGPPAPKQGFQQPPPPPPQPHPTETKPAPPPEPQIPKTQESTPTPKAPIAETKASTTTDDTSLPLQEQQQMWYKQHLENLQKLRQERAKLNQQGDGGTSLPAPPFGQPPPPIEPQSNAPPPPPPKEEPPVPPPPPVEIKPEIPKDPEEAARLEQLQAAAAHWQQVQQQRVHQQYEALMQQHEKLQKILEQYQQVIQQPPELQTMSAEMQLRHYQMQQQQFLPCFQDWGQSFVLWYEQFQSYPHKDQLKDYEHQWKQWQEQMDATNVHLQERVATISALVPFPSSQYNSGMMGQLGQYPGQDMQMQQQQQQQQQQQAGNMGTEQSSFSGGSVPQSAPSTGFGAQLPAAPPVQGNGPDGAGVQPLVPPVHPPSFKSVGGSRGSNPRFDQPDEQYGGPPRPDQPQQHFDGPPRFNQPPQQFDGPQRFNQPPQRFDGPPRFEQPPQRFDGPPRFDQPPQRFDGPPRFDQPPQRFDGPPRFDQPPQRFDGPPRFDQPRQHFNGPPRFDQPRQRFDGPPRFDHPRQRFDGPPRFDQPQQRFDSPQRFSQPRPLFDGPPRFDQPRFGQRQRFEMSRHPGPSTHLENPSAPHQNQPQDLQPPAVSAAQNPSMENKEESASNQKLLGKEKKDSDNNIKKKDSAEEDMTNDNLLGASGFFVPKDPIPQTLKKTAEKPGEKSKPAKSVSASSIASKGSAEPLKTNPPQINSKPTESKTGKQDSGQLPSRQQLPMPSTGRGRGQPPVPFQNQGRGRGQGSVSEFAGPGTEPVGEEIEEGPYGYVPPEENMGMQEEQDNSYWEEPCFENFGGGDSENPPEDIWMPEEHIYPEEEYYEESMGRPPFGRGRPPMMRGGPPRGRGGPAMGRGGPPMGRGGPPMGRGGFPMFRGRPPLVRGAPMGRGGPPMGRGRPPMRRGGPPLGRGEPIDGPWEEFEPPEYSEEGDAYWRPRGPMRGMRPPFPPGRGRPPRGHPAFMHPERGRPPHPGRGLVDEESYDYGIDDPTTDPSGPPMYHEQDPHSHLMHPGFGRGRRPGPPPPPHEIMDEMEELYYDEEHGPGWQPPEGRGPPHPRNEIFERGGMRRMPVGRGMARGMGRPGPEPENYEEEYKEGYIEDYNHGEDRHRWRPPLDYPLEEGRLDARYREPEYEERIPPEREYAPRIHSPEPFRDAHWHEQRERGRPFPYEERDRERGELRIREYREDLPYPPSSDWERSPRHSPLPERGYPDDYPDSRSRFDEQREQLMLDRRSPPADTTTLPVSSVEAASEELSRANVLALSQHQHEIILKAAQELKLIRELQETKTPNADPQTPTSADVLPVLPAGLLGLEIPADVRNVLKGMSAAQTSPTKAGSWENKSAHLQYQPSPSAASLSTVMPKTVDYGHGHEPGNTVERISYGERIVLRPDPMTSDRGYEKELLGSRDPYSRDPYYSRRSDPFLERREYSRERELYRDKPPEYERERYERERYLLRERDDSTQAMVDERSPLSMHRSAYRERDRDGQDRERSGSRDAEEQYGRPPYDRTPYERSGPERYSHSSSPYMERRSYPEDRGPSTAPSLPPPPQPPPRSEKKPEIKNIDDILKQPGRLSRPERIVIIMRGLPGSGKSHVAKLIRDKEVDCGGAPPRVLVLDDYFMTEVEKTQKDPDTGKRVKTKVLEYEYEPELEDTYRSSMLKTFKKTLDDGFFPFIILDTINDKVKHFDQFWSAAKTKGFEVYLAEISAETQTCAKRNVHGRSLKDIMKMSKYWEASPSHMVRLDVRSLLQDAAIEEVEMEDFNPDEEPKELKKEEEEEGDLGYIPRSKWEMDTSEAKLDRLDGLSSGGKRKRESEDTGLEDFLQLPDDYATRKSQPGKKRVRWADLEEQKEADRKRAIGFVVGQTDWERITDESGQLAQRALNRTKYF